MFVENANSADRFLVASYDGYVYIYMCVRVCVHVYITSLRGGRGREKSMLLELLIELIGGADVSHSFLFFFFSFFSFQLVNGLDRPRYVCETEVMEDVNVATATPVEYTPPGNTNKNANGNIITLTLKNNHLIVETEERAVSTRISPFYDV